MNPWTQDILLKIAEMYRANPKARGFKVAIVAERVFDKALVFQRLVQSYISVIVFYNFISGVRVAWHFSPEKTERTLDSLVSH